MKLIKIAERFIYSIYILTFILNMYLGIKEQNGVRLIVAIWVFNAGMMFYLYRITDRFGDERVEKRDELIKDCIKLNVEIIDSIGEDFVSKTQIKEIRDKAEVMDYYTLNDVINDLNIVLGENKDEGK